MDSIRTIGVVGAGTMGHGIAQVAAQHGYDVILVDAVPEALERGRAAVGKGYERLVAKGKLAAEERDQALARLTTGGDLGALTGADLVVEAVVERQDVKEKVLGELDRVCPAGTILATNTSSISITRHHQAGRRHPQAIAPLEPHVPWEEPFLTYRYECYRFHKHPLETAARRDLEAFRGDAPPRLAEGLTR